jgi:titin
MDWLDAYLDNLADGRNVIYPPDKNTWTPVKPNRQQQSMIQDAVAFDQQQQMRMIQEARADLEAHGMSQDDVQAGIGADPGSPAVQLVTASASVPGAPTIIFADCPGDQPCQTLHIEYAQPASDGGSAITDYEYSIDDGENWLSMGRDAEGEFYVYGDAGSIAGQELFVRVRAVNVAGAGAPSALWPEFVCRSCVPSAPLNFAASNGGDCQLLVYYSEPDIANGTITHYELTIDDESTWTNIGFNGLDEEYLFEYNQGPESIGVSVRVRAVNASGAGDATDMIPVILTSCAEQ